MLKIHNNPPRREWPALTARCTRQEGEITERVAAILSQVRTGGDKGAARPRGPHRRLRPREVRGFPQTAHRSGQSRAATAQDGAGDRQVQYRSLPQGTLPPQVDIEVMPGVRCVQRAVAIGRVGALRPGRQCPALLDGADARPPRPDRRVRRGHTLHPGRARREDRPRGAFRRRPVRRRPHLRRRRGAGRGRHGLRHGKHPARGKKSSARETGTSPAPSSW